MRSSSATKVVELWHVCWAGVGKVVCRWVGVTLCCSVGVPKSHSGCASYQVWTLQEPQSHGSGRHRALRGKGGRSWDGGGGGGVAAPAVSHRRTLSVHSSRP